MRHRSRCGFTLVEMLVVVSIVTLLAAMLIPAMEKAAYEARLGRCTTQLRGLAMGVTTYAMNQRNHYPMPPDGRGVNHQRDQLSVPGGSGQPDAPERWTFRDMRRVVQGYIPLTMFVCPMAQPVDFSHEANGAQTTVLANYALYFGFEYTGSHPDGTPDGGLLRVGDRLGFLKSAPSEARRGEYFRILASDLNYIPDGNGPDPQQNQTTHPDYDGRLKNHVFQNQNYYDTPFIVTQSRWGHGQRGDMDACYAYTDASVTLYRDVARRNDRRFGWVPVWPDGAARVDPVNGRWRAYLPRD
jgi:prepilin-type N-terminal cleavage/methylation domain-containing protein